MNMLHPEELKELYLGLGGGGDNYLDDEGRLNVFAVTGCRTGKAFWQSAALFSDIPPRSF